MSNYLGEIIQSTRKSSGMTQDEYGSRYNVSGPAVFKFEKGYVRPSLELWLKMAIEAGLDERRAVLLWTKSKLPSKYAEYIEMQTASQRDFDSTSKRKQKYRYAKIDKRESLLDALGKDRDFPDGLRQLVADNELWALYKPTGDEIEMLIEIFAPLGKGTPRHYREALGLLRDFAGN